MYVYWQSQGINIFDRNGYILKVALFENPPCTEYHDAERVRTRPRPRAVRLRARPQPARHQRARPQLRVARRTRRRRCGPRRARALARASRWSRGAAQAAGSPESGEARRAEHSQAGRRQARGQHPRLAARPVRRRAPGRGSGCRTGRVRRGRCRVPQLPVRTMSRRASASIVANPVLVGAVTVLVVVVAVFLAYNANNGLPFVPTREVFADMSSGSQPGQGQRGARGRLPHRRGRGHHRRGAAHRRVGVPPAPEAGQDRGRHPLRHDDQDPPAVGPGPQVRRADPRPGQGQPQGRVDHPPVPDQRPGPVRRRVQDLRPAHPRGQPGGAEHLRQRLRRARRLDQRAASSTWGRCSVTWSRWPATCPTPTPAWRASSAS